MDLYLVVKTAHILFSTILFGTGIGIAFFMIRSCTDDNPHAKLYAARNTVFADYLFTLPAAIGQPLTGFWLVWKAGYNWTDLWLVLTYIIYLIAAACWLPVVWIQIQLKQMLETSIRDGAPLPKRYFQLFKIWFLLGWPAFIGLVIVFSLMVFKPV